MSVKFIIVLGVIFCGSFLFLKSQALATSGACSWHGGINCPAGMQYDGRVFCNDGWIDSTTYYSFTDNCGSLVSSYSSCFTPFVIGCTTSYDYNSKKNDCNDLYSIYVSAGALEMGSEAYNNCLQELNECQQQIDDYNQGWTNYYQCLDNEAAEKSQQYEEELGRLNNYFEAEETRQDNELCQIKYGENSYASENLCYCNSGYKWNSTQTACIINCSDNYVSINGVCISPTQYCKSIFGSNVYGVGGFDTVEETCFCDSEYIWNSGRTACILKIEEEERQTVSTQINSIITPINTSTEIAEEVGKPVNTVTQETFKKQDVLADKVENNNEEVVIVSPETTQEQPKERIDFFHQIFNGIKSFFSKLKFW